MAGASENNGRFLVVFSRASRADFAAFVAGYLLATVFKNEIASSTLPFLAASRARSYIDFASVSSSARVAVADF